MSLDWQEKEVELIVADYFSMLIAELQGMPINKALHRKQLLPLLNGRSEGSIEFKHQNISAALIAMSLPYIKGYKPRYNFQKLLIEKINQEISNNAFLSAALEGFVKLKVEPKKNIAFEKLIDTPPDPKDIVKESESLYIPRHVNYLEREQNNRNLGEAGEELVMQYEKWRLISIGKENLADRIEWISKEKGDGAGFDILSRNENGSDRYIEVKTTKLSKDAPIFFSKNEFEFSMKHSEDYHLYRVFNFGKEPKMFVKDGAFDQFCQVEATFYRGYF